jgi:hypothetical protein
MTLKDKKTLDSAGFDGTKIGVVKATTTAVALKKLIQDTSTNAEIVLFNSAKDGLENLPEKGFPYTMQWSNLMRHQSENISYRNRSAVRHIFRIENDPAGPGTHAACH